RSGPTAALLPALAAAVEDGAEDVAETAEVAKVLEAEPRIATGGGVGPGSLTARAGAARSAEPEIAERIATHGVVLLALRVVRQHGIRLADLLEPVRCRGVAGVGVRMVFLG